MLHTRLRGVPAHLAPRVDAAMLQGTARAIYLQPGRCASSASGVGNGAESPGCGTGNLPTCLVEWLSHFSPYGDRKTYRTAGSLAADPLTPMQAAGVPPIDWWIALEANPEDVAELGVTVTLVGAPSVSSPLCFFGRFCSEYGDPTKRYRDVERDEDDPAYAILLLAKLTIYERARSLGGAATSVITAAAGLAGVLCLWALWRCVKRILFLPTASTAGYGNLSYEPQA